MNTKNIKGIEPGLRETYFQAREKRLTLNASELSIEAKFPTNALVELTNSCNHACIFCKNADQLRAGVRLNIGTFEKFVSEAVPLGLQEIGLYATGEPFFNKGHRALHKVSENLWCAKSLSNYEWGTCDVAAQIVQATGRKIHICTVYLTGGTTGYP